MNEIENEVMDLAKSIRDTITRGRARSQERIRKAQADLKKIRKGQPIETAIRTKPR